MSCRLRRTRALGGQETSAGDTSPWQPASRGISPWLRTLSTTRPHQTGLKHTRHACQLWTPRIGSIDLTPLAEREQIRRR